METTTAHTTPLIHHVPEVGATLTHRRWDDPGAFDTLRVEQGPVNATFFRTESDGHTHRNINLHGVETVEVSEDDWGVAYTFKHLDGTFTKVYTFVKR